MKIKRAELVSPNILRLMLSRCSKLWSQICTSCYEYTNTCQTVEPSPETNPFPQLWENNVADVFLGLFPKRKYECVRERERQKNGGPQHSHSNLNHRKTSRDFPAVQNFSGSWSRINANKRLKMGGNGKKEKEGKHCCIVPRSCSTNHMLPVCQSGTNSIQVEHCKGMVGEISLGLQKISINLPDDSWI